MKKIMLTSLVAILAATSARAEISPYVSGKLSYGNGTLSETEAQVFTAAGLTQPTGMKLGDTDINHHVSSYLEDVGTTKHSDKEMEGIRANVAVGVEVPVAILRGAFRVETEFGFGGKESFKFPSADDPNWNDLRLGLRYSTYFVNGYYGYNATDKIKPYIGAGIGASNVKSNLSWLQEVDADTMYFVKESQSNMDFAYHFDVGVAYSITDSVTLDLGYRYSNLGTFEVTAKNMASNAYITQAFGLDEIIGGISEMKADLTSHEVMLGVRYTF